MSSHDPKRGDPASQQDRVRALFRQAGEIQPPRALVEAAREAARERPGWLARLGRWIAAYPFLSAGIALASLLGANQAYRALVAPEAPATQARFTAPLGEPVTLTIPLADLDLERARTARVRLAPGLAFVSGAHAEVEGQSEVEMRIEPSVARQGLPLSIRGTEAGTRAISLRLLDADGHPVGERAFEVEVTPAPR